MKNRIWNDNIIKMNRIHSKFLRAKNSGYMDRYKAARSIADNMKKGLIKKGIPANYSAAIAHGMKVMRKKRIIYADKLAHMLAYK